ncbi:ribosome hibernation-promoting factor, HPF/YfiA family [Roseimarinus sediminis]|uniref:ribosome hibernation-promoting factor, HPF/YfiA family n=1 Tax=Roseimarinus sediminis TaxID=1610899 RepID=UPI003D232BF0
MNIKINDVHFNADQKLVELINKKVNKLDTFFDGILKAEVILKVIKPETSNNKEVEIKVSIPANDYLFAKKQADSFEQALDMALEAVRRQLKKYKEKLQEK